MFARKTLQLVLIEPKVMSTFSPKTIKELRRLGEKQVEGHNIVMSLLGINTLPELAPTTYKLSSLTSFPMYSFILGGIQKNYSKITVTPVESLDKIQLSHVKDVKSLGLVMEMIHSVASEYPECNFCGQHPRNLLNNCINCNSYKNSFYKTLMGNLFEVVSKIEDEPQALKTLTPLTKGNKSHE